MKITDDGGRKRGTSPNCHKMEQELKEGATNVCFRIVYN
jgi:hypothetical protein